MYARSAFFAIFSMTLVLANPVPESRNHGIVSVYTQNYEADFHDDVQTRNLMTKWNSLKIKWSKIIDDGLNDLNKIKHQGENTFDIAKKEWKVLREKGLHLIDEVKKTYLELKEHGKGVYAELKKMFELLEESLQHLKAAGHEAAVDAKDLLSELKKSMIEAESVADPKPATR